MSTDAQPFKSSFRLEAEARGEARGWAKSVLIVLNSRKVSVPEEIRQRILDCTDVALLQTWLDRAIHATRIEQVID
ncbi:hypothetical protein GCM10027589_05750 [Actinocorallia lasiicapitis]